MPYHTGTPKSSRTRSGAGCQYRYIEDLWSNLIMWVDGIYFNSSTNKAYCIKNPSSFSDSTGGTLIGTTTSSDGGISSRTIPTARGFEYALIPAGIAGTNHANYCSGSTGGG
jgi:hypothetical protein